MEKTDTIHLIMDNDSGYVSNNLEPESNSDLALDSSETSTVDILRSFLPKPVYLSEDALLECPQIDESNSVIGCSPEIVESSVKSDEVRVGLPSFNSSQSDLEQPSCSFAVPIIEPVYFDLSVVCPASNANVSEKEEKRDSSNTYETPRKGMKRKLSECDSPELFADEESSKPKVLPSPKFPTERFCHKFDQKLLKRVQNELSGVPPPPDFTISRFTVHDMLKKLHENASYFWTEENLLDISKSSLNSSRGGRSILIDGDHQEAIKKDFPEILYSRHHGLHFNRTKVSEEIEHLCDKYAKRYVGAETQSTCNAVETKYASPSRRKGPKPMWSVKSPGRRLSHLAKRRITFSSSNLQNGIASASTSSSSAAASRARQILIDYKKSEIRERISPKKTPSKSPYQGHTPSSSAKKKLRMRFRLLSGDLKEMTSNLNNSKRALFQSPDDNKNWSILSNSSTSSCSSFSNDFRSKRTLFPSPTKRLTVDKDFRFDRKRKRDGEEEEAKHPSKIPKSENQENASQIISKSGTIVDLSAAHKKKLQWAVYESLKLQNITTSHPDFKTFATVLARVTRRLILTSNMRLEGIGTSDKMFRIAKHHSFAVVKGKSVDEIMNEYNKNRAKIAKPQGYVAPQDATKSESCGSSALKDRSNTKNYNARPFKVESRIDRIRKVINFEDNR